MMIRTPTASFESEPQLNFAPFGSVLPRVRLASLSLIREQRKREREGLRAKREV